MTRRRKAALIAGLAVLLGAQAVYTILLSGPEGARIQSPEPGIVYGRDFVVSGDAWMKPGQDAIDGIEIVATPLGPQAVGPVSFEARRHAIMYRGELLLTLHQWIAEISLPASGRWSLVARVRGNDGRMVESAARAVEVAAAPPRHFRSWSAEHLVSLVAVAAATLAVVLLIRRKSTSFESWAPWLGLAIWLNDIAFQVYWFVVGGWSPSGSIMLHMCGLAIVLIPPWLLMEEGKMRDVLGEFLYFWGFGGAVQALIAPDVGASGFPTYRFISFFASHGLIIVCVAAMVAAGRVRIRFSSLARVFLGTNLLLLPIAGVNRLLALIPPYVPANYFVLSYPPPTGSVVDLFVELFGPAPFFIIGLELMAAAVFALLWLPWAALAWAKERPPTCHAPRHRCEKDSGVAKQGRL